MAETTFESPLERHQVLFGRFLRLPPHGRHAVTGVVSRGLWRTQIHYRQWVRCVPGIQDVRDGARAMVGNGIRVMVQRNEADMEAKEQDQGDMKTGKRGAGIYRIKEDDQPGAFTHLFQWFLTDVDSTSTRFKNHPAETPTNQGSTSTAIQGSSGHTIQLFSPAFSRVFQHFLGGMAFQGRLRWFVIMVYPAASLDGKPHSGGLQSPLQSLRRAFAPYASMRALGLTRFARAEQPSGLPPRFIARTPPCGCAALRRPLLVSRLGVRPALRAGALGLSGGF